MINPMSLEGKRILVTGASSGIGRASAIYFSRLGAKVILLARSIERLNETFDSLEKNDEHYVLSYDLTDIEGIEDMLEKILMNKHPLNGFVHCSGISALRPIHMVKPAFLHHMMLINFYSFIEIVRYLSIKNHMENGSIVAISSVASIRGDKSLMPYCASKAAIEGSVRALACELASKQIRVNSIQPSMIKTKMADGYDVMAGAEAFNELFKKQYLGLGEPDDVASMAAYLLSDAAKFITGASFLVDGGYSSH